MGLVTERIELKYSLTFEAPFHFGTGLRNGLIHRTVARDGADYLYVPGSTLKGLLRERCEQLARLFELTTLEPHAIEDSPNRIREARRHDPDIINRIFGSRFLAGQVYFDNALMVASPPESGGDIPAIGRDYFDGQVDEGDEPSDQGKQIEQGKYKARQVESRTQVSLSRQTRAAKPGHLYTSEYGIRYLRFNGQIYGSLAGYILNGTGPGTSSLLLLLAGLLSLDRMGGQKSTGAGQVRVAIEKPDLLVEGQPVSIEAVLAQLSDLEYDELEREEAGQ